MKTQISAELARLDKGQFAQLLVQMYYTILSQRLKGPIVGALTDLASTYLVCASRQHEGEGLLGVHRIDSHSGKSIRDTVGLLSSCLTDFSRSYGELVICVLMNVVPKYIG